MIEIGLRGIAGSDIDNDPPAGEELDDESISQLSETCATYQCPGHERGHCIPLLTKVQPFRSLPVDAVQTSSHCREALESGKRWQWMTGRQTNPLDSFSPLCFTVRSERWHSSCSIGRREVHETQSCLLSLLCDSSWPMVSCG